jgi:hypothetical protein
VLALVAALALGSPSRSAPAAGAAEETPNAVLHWSAVAEAAITAGRPPASSSVLGGMVHGAAYDAVAATAGGLKPFATRVTAPAGASADAAVAQAARDVLVARVPAQAATVQAAYDAAMAALPDGPAKEAGKAVGAAAAAGMLATRTGDRFDDTVPYVQKPPGPGVFEPIAPTPPVDVKLGTVRPFTFATQSAHRPPGPLRLGSRTYARDLVEARDLARAASSLRTPAQTETVRFFGTKRVPLTLTSTVTGTTRTYPCLDDLHADVEDARVWGGLHLRTTMTDTHAHFPRIARDVAKRRFRLARPRG